MVLGADGSMFVDDVQAGDLWNFPAGLPHSIQGLEENGCEILLVFNQGSFSEESTFLLSDWLKHTQPEVLRKNLHLDSRSLAKLPKAEPLYIFDSARPTNTLEQDRAEVALRAPLSKVSYTFKASTTPPIHEKLRGIFKGCCRHRSRETGRPEGVALAPECERLAILDSGLWTHDCLQCRGERAHS